MKLFQRIALIAVCAIAYMSAAQADHLTSSQESTLRAAILAEPALAQAVAIRNDSAIAEYCNAAAVPTQKAWKTSYPSIDLFAATDINVYIARSVAERQAFDLLVNRGTVDPTVASLRSGIVNIFSGAGGAAQRAAILTDMTRSATWAEQKFGGTNQTTDTVTAWKLNFSGPITAGHVSAILNAGN